MAGGPRKFSEKIALLNQKEAEGNAAFDSIMVEVKSIRPNNSGSQLDMIDSLTDNSLKSKSHCSNIEEAISFNENINVTYESHQHNPKSFTNQFQSNNKSKKLENRHLITKKNEQSENNFQQHQISNNTFLQLPNHTDSFRRAHSDSSLNQTVANTINNNSFLTNQQNNQANYINQNPNVQFQSQYNTNFQQNIYQGNYSDSNNYLTQQNQHFSINSNELNNVQFKNFSQPLTNVVSNVSSNLSNNLSSNSISANLTMPIQLPIKNNVPPLLTQNQIQTNISNINSSSINQSSQSTLASSSLQLNLIDSNQSNQQNYFQAKLINNNKNDIQQLSANNPSISSSRNVSSIYNLSPTQNFNTNHQLIPQQYQTSMQQNAIINSDLLSPNLNNNLLNPNTNNTTGGSLPDLTAFQFQNSRCQQSIQLIEYNQRLNHNQLNYESQLLQPNFQQHNHIGPVKPTHNGSVSPTRGMSRYNPTHTNLNNNRRPSPQRHVPTNLKTQSINNSTSLSVHSTPTSPMQPSIQSLQPLEFTINSQQVNNYMNGNLINGAGILNNNGNISNNNNVYRNGSSTGANGESLPPSPQSQQSCFNSPQGSPGPFSISPQDISPFSTSNNYDIMQKKFDSINLDSSNNSVNFNQYLINNSNNVLAQTLNLMKPLHNSSTININNLTNNKNLNISQNNTEKNKNNNIISNNNSKNITNIDSDINQNSINSQGGSLSSNGSENNILNSSNIYEDITSNFHQNQQSIYINKNNLTSHSNNSSLINKTHKNSIPNIILTLSGDSIEEKNDVIIKDLTNDLNYEEDLLIKNEQFDLDLQILSENVTIDDQNPINFDENNI